MALQIHDVMQEPQYVDHLAALITSRP